MSSSRRSRAGPGKALQGHQGKPREPTVTINYIRRIGSFCGGFRRLPRTRRDDATKPCAIGDSHLVDERADLGKRPVGGDEELFVLSKLRRIAEINALAVLGAERGPLVNQRAQGPL
jgi:hypothetical protein